MVVRRSRRKALDARAARRTERRTYIASVLDGDEHVLAAGRDPAAVTGTRMILAWTLMRPPRTGEWTGDSVRFDEIISWRRGQTHDERPVVAMTHPEHRRMGRVPAHRFLWFRWESAEAPVPHRSTRFTFVSSRDPLYAAVVDGLRRAGTPEGEPFREQPPGTRAHRIARSRGVLTRRRRGWVRYRAGRRGWVRLAYRS